MPKMPSDSAFLPVELHHVWGIFLELSPYRKKGMTLGLIPYSEIVAWMGYTGTKLSAMERKMLAVVDRLFVNAIQEREDKK